MLLYTKYIQTIYEPYTKSEVGIVYVLYYNYLQSRQLYLIKKDNINL